MFWNICYNWIMHIYISRNKDWFAIGFLTFCPNVLKEAAWSELFCKWLQGLTQQMTWAEKKNWSSFSCMGRTQRERVFPDFVVKKSLVFRPLKDLNMISFSLMDYIEGTNSIYRTFVQEIRASLNFGIAKMVPWSGV